MWWGDEGCVDELLRGGEKYGGGRGKQGVERGKNRGARSMQVDIGKME